MTESQFNEVVEAVFAKIERAIDASEADMECYAREGVLEIEDESGHKIIINRHAPTQELWIASKLGGNHFKLANGNWLNTRQEGAEFFATLEKTVAQLTGSVIKCKDPD